MKKTISILLSLAMIVVMAVPSFAVSGEQSPVIVETVYPTEDVVIADIIATDAPYYADNTGEEDSTEAIQKAIDDCASQGGGTVFLPVGEYKLTGSIYIRPFVTLRGDYCDPDMSKEYGTLIVADVPSSDEMNPALFTVGASAGAVGLTVWYPEQSIDDVKPYPYTFFVEGNDDYMLQTIKDCTMINPYRGIGASSECEKGIYQCHEMLTIENVKGTCLYEGLNAHNSADVDTIKTLYILNKYWANAGEEFNSPSLEEINEYTRENAYGLVLGDLEWPQFADVRIAERKYGVMVKQGIRYMFSGIFTDLYIADCTYGFYITEGAMQKRGESWGVGITSSVIEGSEYAIYNPCWCTVLLTDVVTEGAVEGNCINRYYATIDQYSPDYDRSYTKVNNNLYVVDADTSGKTDASATVQAVLDEASSTGGVVYMPAGLYRFENPITVPGGVELRGSSSVAARCQRGNSSGTLIVSFYGYNEGDQALITLGGDGAGLNGIRVDFPLNNPTDNSGEYMATAPIVYSEADDIYITNCFFTLASCGVKLNGSDNAFIKKVVGCCYESMFDISSSTDCYLEGCLQNGNALPRTGYENFDIPELKGRITEDKLFDYVFIPITRVKTDYIKLENSHNITVFNSFIYGGKTFLNSKDSTALLINVGHDGSSKTESALIMSGGEVTVVNSMRSTSDGQQSNNFYSTDGKTVFRAYNNQAVDLMYCEHTILENVEVNYMDFGDILYSILQPIYRFIAMICDLFMSIEI